MNSLIGKEILWVRSSTKQFLCTISDIEMGRRVSEIKISESDNDLPVLSILVSRVDNNHPERKWLDQCLLVSSKKNQQIDQLQISKNKSKIHKCYTTGVQAFEIDGLSFKSLKSAIDSLNACGEI